MINTPRGSYLVRGWDDDLKQLKHYRWVRNKIAHEPDCTEQNMCEPSDTVWLDDFCSRIMNQTDPLALYSKATKPRPAQKSAQAHKPESPTYTYSQSTANHKKSSPKRKELQVLNKQLSEDIFFMLNNMNLRHNNRSKKDMTKYKEYVAKMSKARLEKWYDELYQMLLLAFLLLDKSAWHYRWQYGFCRGVA